MSILPLRLFGRWEKQPHRNVTIWIHIPFHAMFALGAPKALVKAGCSVLSLSSKVAVPLFGQRTQAFVRVNGNLAIFQGGALFAGIHRFLRSAKGVSLMPNGGRFPDYFELGL